LTDPKPWTVEYERRAIKDLGRLDRPVRERIVTAIDRLAAHDPTADVKRLSGMPCTACESETGAPCSPKTATA
jgi:hypothetical protein